MYVVNVHLLRLVGIVLLVMHHLLAIVVLLRLLERFLLNRASLSSGRIGHDTLRFGDGLESHSAGSGALALNLMIVVRLRLIQVLLVIAIILNSVELLVGCLTKVRVSLLREFVLIKRHHSIVDKALVHTLVDGAEALTNTNFLKRIIPGAHQILSLLSICECEEVSFGVKPAVRYRLITLLACRFLDGRARLLIIRAWKSNGVADLSSVAFRLSDKVGLVTTWNFVFALRSLSSIRIELLSRVRCYNMMRSWQQALRLTSP